MNFDMNFRGMRWQLPEVAQGGEWATTAHNMYRINTALEPLRAGAKSTALPTADFLFAQKLFLHDDKLVATSNEIDFASTQVVGDKSRRLYFVENGLLQFLPKHEIPTTYPTPTINGHRSGVQAPSFRYIGALGSVVGMNAAALIRADADKDDNSDLTVITFDLLPDNQKSLYQETAFIYTYVNKYGEEGPPSLPSDTVMARPDATKILLSFIAKSSDPDIVGIRVYMLVEGAWFRIHTPEVSVAETATTAEIPNLTFLNDSAGNIPVTTYLFAPSSVRDEMISEEWDMAPSGLLHMASLDNGVLAVASDYDIYLSEPYYWHAFPESNRYSVEGTIKAIANIGGGFAVLTDRGTQFFFGTNPATMVQSAVSFPYSITDKSSLTEFEGGAVYVCDDGVAIISASGGQIATDGWIDRESWRTNVKLTECRTEMYEGRVVLATRNPENNNPIGYVLNLEIGEITSFDVSTSALQAGFIRDPRSNEVCYVIDTVGLGVFNRGNQLVALWESGDIWLPYGVSLNTLYVQSDEYPVTVKVTPKNRTTRTIIVTGTRPMRMPATDRARSIRVRVESGQQVGRCALANDMKGF